MYVHEVQARDLIGGPLERAMLNEWTTIDIPGVNVDGLSQASTTYVGSQSMGRVGFATYTTKSPYSTQYSGGVLEKGTTIQRSNDVDPRYGSGGYNSPLDIAAQAEAVRLTTPNLTIEQVRLSPDFGSPKMAGDLSNLVPGVVLGIDYADTCAFNVPTTTVDLEFRFAWRYGGQVSPSVPAQDMYSYVFTPRSTSAVNRARLEQLDVSVVAGEQGITEDVKASLVPFVEWDGTLPSGWQEIKNPPPQDCGTTDGPERATPTSPSSASPGHCRAIRRRTTTLTEPSLAAISCPSRPRCMGSRLASARLSPPATCTGGLSEPRISSSSCSR